MEEIDSCLDCLNKFGLQRTKETESTIKSKNCQGTDDRTFKL